VKYFTLSIYFMKKILIISVIAVLLVCVGAAGCIGGEAIVGNWIVSGTDIPVVFNSDGTGTMTITTLGIVTSVPMNWEKVTEKTYKITGTSAGLVAGTYTISNDGESLVEVNSGVIVFGKAQ